MPGFTKPEECLTAEHQVISAESDATRFENLPAEAMKSLLHNIQAHISATKAADPTVTGFNVFSIDNTSEEPVMFHALPRRDDDGHNEIEWYERYVPKTGIDSGP